MHSLLRVWFLPFTRAWFSHRHGPRVVPPKVKLPMTRSAGAFWFCNAGCRTTSFGRSGWAKNRLGVKRHSPGVKQHQGKRFADFVEVCCLDGCDFHALLGFIRDGWVPTDCPQTPWSTWRIARFRGPSLQLKIIKSRFACLKSWKG